MRKKLFSVVVVLAAVALVYAFFSSSGALRSDDSASQISQQKKTIVTTELPSNLPDKTMANSQPTMKQSALSARAFSPMTLPAADVPLVTVFQQLKNEAAEGNAFAACRVFSDSMRCMALAEGKIQQERFVKEYEGMNAASPEAIELRKYIESKAAKFKKDEKLCAGVEKLEKLEPWRYLLQAAFAGNMKAKEEFVLLSPIDRDDYSQNSEYLDAYRAYAPSYLLEAANAGYGRAVSRTAWGYLGPIGGSRVFIPGFGIKLVEPNLYLAAVYTFALDSLPTHREQSASQALREKVQSLLSPADLAKAKAEAAIMVAKWKPEVINERRPNEDNQKPLVVVSMADRCASD